MFYSAGEDFDVYGTTLDFPCGNLAADVIIIINSLALVS
jgi:hypothetical protein